MEGYTFEKMWLDLKNGYQIYYTYVGNRYVLFKTADNCYTQKLLSTEKKNPQPKLIRVGQKNPPARMSMVTKKYVMEIYPFMEDIEYRINNM